MKKYQPIIEEWLPSRRAINVIEFEPNQFHIDSLDSDLSEKNDLYILEGLSEKKTPIDRIQLNQLKKMYKFRSIDFKKAETLTTKYVY